MSASFRVTVPEDVRVTLTCTLTVKEWGEVAQHLHTEKGVVGYPLQRAIWDLHSQVCQTFWPSAKVTQP